MNCPNCGAANPEGSRFCGRCGNGLEPSPTASPIPGLSESTVRQAGGVVGVVAALLAAVGLGMAADYMRDRVAARVGNCACGCLFALGFILCALAYGLIQTLSGK